MPNMSPKKNPMPSQDPHVRNKNYLEVATGYTVEMAQDEAARCLNCKHMPCVSGCPVNVKIPDFIAKIVEGDFEGAYQVISSTNALPAISGRVCPQENQCESKCVRGIKTEPVGIGRLERFVADWHRENVEDKIEKPASNGKKVAVAGSGPSSLTCAADLAKLGYEVTVFEAFHVAGGVLVYGIPEFRLPKAIVAGEVEKLKKLGVTVMTDILIGKTISIDELFDEYGFDAVFVGTGAGLPMFMKIPGEGLDGVYSANEYLTRLNLMKAYDTHYDTPIYVGQRVVVVGGGNVAMDAVRTAKRLGAEATIVYRRSEKELPARVEEVHHAKEEGIVFRMLANPVEVLGDEQGWVRGLRCVEMTLGEPDESGRRRPVEKEGSEFDVPCDVVIMALGTSPNPLLAATTSGLETDRRGCLTADAEGRTTRAGVFAGGDAVTGAATVILAMGAGRRAARAIDEYIREKYQPLNL